jgi:adenylate kinase family enzyme
MQRVMIIGQPGSGKSTLARDLGAVTRLPVYHMDQIHWMPGWQERPSSDKVRLAREVYARDEWVFEGGFSQTWAQRLDRADTLIWLDTNWPTRVWRVAMRTLRDYGRTRPDLPDDCPEQFSLEFYRWIWDTRHTGRARMRKFFDSAQVSKHRFTSFAQSGAFLQGLAS